MASKAKGFASQTLPSTMSDADDEWAYFAPQFLGPPIVRYSTHATNAIPHLITCRIYWMTR
jgi:hypothetical protein